MNLAALLDLGVPKEYLIQELLKLNLDQEYEVKIEKAAKLGITGTRVDVILKHELISKEEALHNHSDNHIHEHVHEHCHRHDDENHHTHDHSHENHVHINSNNYEHHHRSLKDIENIINSSDLKDNVKKMSLDMFMKVAEAEAKVHGKALYEVHFYEVGAIDSIVDIVGAAICLDYLQVDKIIASSVQLGGGFVKCAHGVIPVPAPATVEILKDIPVNIGRVPFETTTPTGAAILKANVKELGVKHEIIEAPIIDSIKFNPEDRCYLCKTAVFNMILSAAKEQGYNCVIDGTNFDDIKDYRPGLKALKELDVKSPLLECKLTKSEIMAFSKESNLNTWDKPPYSCLLTRIPYENELREEDFVKIENAEKYMMSIGFRAIRVRCHGDLARIEVNRSDRSKLFNETLQQSK
jgi:uncharacterized protein (TIGR00268 family)